MQSFRGEIMRGVRALQALLAEPAPVTDYDRLVFAVKAGAIIRRLEEAREDMLVRVLERIGR